MAGPSLEKIVNAELLRWARTASSLDVDSAARKIGITPEKLTSWESNAAAPTLTQLRKLANVYKRAVTFFFLNERPPAAKKPADFRRLDLSTSAHSTPELSNAIREAQAKREAALDIYAETEEPPPPFNLKIAPSDDPEVVASKMLEWLGISLEERAQWDDYGALRAWKTAAEASGVLVMQVARVSLDEMRGCSLALFPLPIVLLNSSDSPLGRVFSLLHELTHLARNESALCDISEQKGIELFCNHVAGGILVPRAPLLAYAQERGATNVTQWTNDELVELRNRFRASREVVLRRLLLIHKTSRAFYQRKREEFLKEYAELRANKSGGFVPFSRKVVLGNGRLLTGLVLDAYDSRVITGSELSRILGTKLDHLPAIISELHGRDVA